MFSIGSSNPPTKKMAPAWGAEAKLGLLLLGSLASQAATYNDSVIHTCPQVYLIKKAHKNEK
jgi:hypothetical protein